MKYKELRSLWTLLFTIISTITIVLLWWKYPGTYVSQFLVLSVCHFFMCGCLIYIVSKLLYF